MIDLNEYTYNLPEERIAKFPLAYRDSSKLLIYRNGNISTKTFHNLDQNLSTTDFLVFNNTRVIPARLEFKKGTGAKIEIFCLTPVSPADYNLVFQQTHSCIWTCMVGNLKKWKEEELTLPLKVKGKSIQLRASKQESKGDSQLIQFQWDNQEVQFMDILAIAGKTPIPPYLKRESLSIDRERYQTVYSLLDGSVAAPTAGLHFTPHVFEKLSSSGINHDYITLHVGAGTFQPIKKNNIGEHEMHSEPFEVNVTTIEHLIEHSKNIVAVGTTTLRTLESIYWYGAKMINQKLIPNPYINQWIWEEEKEVPVKDSLQAILDYMYKEHIFSLKLNTKIMIIPGYIFKIPNALVTNFHQPHSTLLLLVAAFIGDEWKKVYRYALDNDYRFLSYGDGSLLFRKIEVRS